MPTYSYRRADGSTFDIEQRITEPALTVCPTTGQAVTRMITGGAGLVFKGSGFYLTDYARKSASGGSSSPKTSDSGSAATQAEPKKGETKTSGGESKASKD